MGIGEILLIIFIACKCIGIGAIANWSWGMVLIPLWVDLGIYGIIFVIILIKKIKYSRY